MLLIFPSEKQRVPAWCDRILWKTHVDIEGLQAKQRKYFSPIYSLGDHKPVAGTFDVNVGRNLHVFSPSFHCLDKLSAFTVYKKLTLFHVTITFDAYTVNHMLFTKAVLILYNFNSS